MKRRFAAWQLGFGIALALLLGLLGTTFMAAPLPAPAPLASALPPASPPPDMAVFHLPAHDQRGFARMALLH